MLALLLVFALLLSGCTQVNQTNSFVDMPTAETVEQTEVPAAPDMTQPPTMAPNIVPATITDVPQTTTMPMPTDQLDISPEATPEETPAPNGLNG